MSLSCFGDGVSTSLLDQEPFKFRHTPLGHLALSLENLARVIPARPKDQVMYAGCKLQTADDFESTSRKRPEDQTIEAVIENIRTTDFYVMVSSTQVDASFEPLYRQLIGGVESLMCERGVGRVAVTPKPYLFIASPNSVTPFYIDRYSTFLMQFRGDKPVTVSQPWDPRVVSVRDCEDYVAYVNTHHRGRRTRTLTPRATTSVRVRCFISSLFRGTMCAAALRMSRSRCPSSSTRPRPWHGAVP